jgi:hypothetical protein
VSDRPNPLNYNINASGHFVKVEFPSLVEETRERIRQAIDHGIQCERQLRNLEKRHDALRERLRELSDTWKRRRICPCGCSEKELIPFARKFDAFLSETFDADEQAPEWVESD